MDVYGYKHTTTHTHPDLLLSPIFGVLLLMNINELLTIRPLGLFTGCVCVCDPNVFNNYSSSPGSFSPPHRSPTAGGHVQLLVSRSVGAIRFLRHVWLWRAELSAGREEEMDAIVTETRVCSGEDASSTKVTHKHVYLDLRPICSNTSNINQ